MRSFVQRPDTSHGKVNVMSDFFFTVGLCIFVGTFCLVIGKEIGYNEAFVPNNKPRMDCVASSGIWENDACWKKTQ